MISVLLIILIILWIFGYLNLPGLVLPDLLLFTINGQPITLWDIITLLIISWIVGLLPSPFREIAGILLVLWVLSVLGFLAIGGLSGLLLPIIIIGLIVYLVMGR